MYNLVFMYVHVAGLIHDDLKMFLMNNIPTGKKKSKVTLGVSDPKLGATIQETLDIQCTSGESKTFTHLSSHNWFTFMAPIHTSL